MKEWWWAYDRVTEHIKERAESGRPVNSTISDDIAWQIEHRSGNSVCVACFSSRPEDSSQWNSYAESGQGVAIGFRWDKLTEALNTQHLFSVSGPVIYSHDETERRLAEAVEILDNELARGNNLCRTSKDPISLTAALLKNPSFESEREFRIVALGVPYPKYRFFPRPNTIVPYVPFPIELTYVTEIRLGPASAKESEDAWNLLLAQLGNGGLPPGMKVLRSTSSLR